MTDAPATADGTTEIAAPEQLKLIIDQIRNMEDEKKAIADQIKDAYAAAKAQGYDTRTLKRIIALMNMDKASRDEADMMLETYMVALGMK